MFFIFLNLKIIFIHAQTQTTISKTIENKELVSSQKCFTSAENSESSTKIYEIINDLSSNTIFIQYSYLESFSIYESNIDSNSSLLYKNQGNSTENFGYYYLTMNSSVFKYYIKFDAGNKFKICLNSFVNKGNSFVLNPENNKTKISTFSLMDISNLKTIKLKYALSNFENKNFYAVRFSEEKLNIFEKIELEVKINYEKQEKEPQKIKINKFYLKNKHYYVLFLFEKKSDEIINEILLSLKLSPKVETSNENKQYNFDLELIDSQEIPGEFTLEITKKISSPKIYYIDLYKHITIYDRDILILSNFTESNNLKMFIAPSYNINKFNTVEIKKNFIDLNKNTLANQNYKDVEKNLSFIILDENDSENKEYFFNFIFYGGYRNLIHYNEKTTSEKIFDKNKKIMINETHCRPQLFINYFNNESTEKILDYVSIIGNFKLYNSDNINSASSIENYFNSILKSPVDNINYSILKKDYDTFMYNCDKIFSKAHGYIIAFDKNDVNNVLEFVENEQRTLYLIEPKKQYEFTFGEKLVNTDFNFRVRILRKNLKENQGRGSLEINYQNKVKNLDINQENLVILKHEKDNKNSFKINYSGEEAVIIEIIKQIDIDEKDIIYFNKETTNKKINQKNTIVFSYDKSQIYSSNNKIIITNNGTNAASLCITKGYGIYPFILKPNCNNKEEFVTLESNKKLVLSYTNPFKQNSLLNQNLTLYVAIVSENELSYSYSFQNEITLKPKEELKISTGKQIIKTLKEGKYNTLSLYYQINLCKNGNFKEVSYSYGNNMPTVLESTNVYKEISDAKLFTFIINGNFTGKFKYNYAPKGFLNIPENQSFNREIKIKINNNKLFLNFNSPFIGKVKLLVLITGNEKAKFDDYCSLMDYSNINTGNLKIDRKLFFVKKNLNLNKDNSEIELNITKNELSELEKQNINIHVINKQFETELEFFYESKSINLNFDGNVNIIENKGDNVENKGDNKKIENDNNIIKNKDIQINPNEPMILKKKGGSTKKKIIFILLAFIVLAVVIIFVRCYCLRQSTGRSWSYYDDYGY